MVTQAALRGGDAGQYSSGNGDNGASVHTYIHIPHGITCQKQAICITGSWTGGQELTH